MSFTLNIFDMAEKYGLIMCQIAGIRIEKGEQVPLFMVKLQSGQIFSGTRFEIGNQFTEIMVKEIRESHGTATCCTEDNNATATIAAKRRSVQGAKNA